LDAGAPGGNGAWRAPFGYRLQQRIPFLRHLGARIFGLGVWPVRLSPAPAPRMLEISPLPVRT
jgi:hypothetical protein